MTHARTPQAGFTLLELITAMAVAAVLITIGIPSFASFTTNQRVKTTAFEMVVLLNYARSEAIKRNQPVSLQAAGSTWTLEVDSELRTLTIPASVDIDSGVDNVTFMPDGRSTSAVVFTVCDVDGSEAVTRRTVRLDVSGRPNITRGDNCAA